MGDKAAKSASKPRSKIIVSGIPPETTEELFLESVLKEWSECVNYVDFYQGKKTVKTKKLGRVYINFTNLQSLQEFVQKYQGKPIQEKSHYKLHIEYAPFQTIPGPAMRKNPRESTIENDKEYLAFLEEREKPKESTTNAESALEKKLQEDAKLLSESGEPLPIISPLLLDLKKKKERNDKKKALLQKKKDQATAAAKKEQKETNNNKSQRGGGAGRGKPFNKRNTNRNQKQTEPEEGDKGQSSKRGRGRGRKRKPKPNQSSGNEGSKPQPQVGSIKIQSKPKPATN